jgi:plasmid stability protein
MDKRNITFSLPADLVRKAKVHAAEHDTTINALVRDLLQEALSSESRTQTAVKHLLTLAEHGPYFTADPGSIRREELHERH